MTSRTVVPGARHWPLAALLLASVLWGGAITGTKYALRAFDPVGLLSVELAAATAALWAVLLILGYRPPPSWPTAARPPATSASSEACSAPASTASWRSASPTTATH